MTGIGCTTEQACITCRDAAIVMSVREICGSDARCDDDAFSEAGRATWVALELVGEVHVGDRLLVHAGVAIERLEKG